MNAVLVVLCVLMVGDSDVRRFHWNPIQYRLIQEMLRPTVRHVDVEGGIRAGKTTPLVHGTGQVAVAFPGINQRLARWTDDSLDSQLKPAWREAAHEQGLDIRWNAEEHCDEVLCGGTLSRVYLGGLKPGEGAARFGKIRGKTLARIGVDQAEELPPDFWGELKGRLSQPGYPQQVVITPQPVNDSHWIADEFPEDNSRPDFLYIRTNAYDNRRILGDAYIQSLELAYPLGTAQRRTLLEGRRGLAVHGPAVYAGYFNRQIHEIPVTLNPHVPLLESWDFGHSHPCVVWAQILPIGVFQILGAVMGRDLYLEDFAPIALSYRAQWCPNPMQVFTTGDPAGSAVSSQGLSSRVVDILADHGIQFSSIGAANQPEIRYQAIQGIGQYMRRMAMDGQPAFRVSPRAVVVSKGGVKEKPFLSDGFEAGYVWDDRALIGTRASIRRPKKDGEYDHGQNCVEYIQIAFGTAQPTQQTVQKFERKAMREAQRDYDPDDLPGRRRRDGAGRGGY